MELTITGTICAWVISGLFRCMVGMATILVLNKIMIATTRPSTSVMVCFSGVFMVLLVLQFQYQLELQGISGVERSKMITFVPA